MGQLLSRFLTRGRLIALGGLAAWLVSFRLFLLFIERRDLPIEPHLALLALPFGLVYFHLFWCKPNRHFPPGILGNLAYAKDRAELQLLRACFALVLLPSGMLLYARYRATRFSGASLEDRIVLLAASGLMMIGLTAAPFAPTFRRWFFRRFGSFLPLTYCFATAIVGVGFFSTLAYFAIEGNTSGAGPFLVDADGGVAQVNDPTGVFEFFSWHLFNAVPVLAIPDTLKWSPPFTYSHPSIGLLVLAFKVVVIGPSVGMVVAWWGERRSRAIAEAVRCEPVARAGDPRLAA